MTPNKVDHTDRSNYPKWVVLALIALTAALTVSMPIFAIPVLFAEISNELGLNILQVGMIWGSSSLAGLFTGLFGGSFSDRFGTNRTLIIACVLSGIIGALRGFAVDYYTLTATFFIGGFLGTTIPSILSKVNGCWFSGKHLGAANGVFSVGMAVGSMAGAGISATYLSPWLGGWRQVIFFYSVISILVGLAWFFVPSPPTEKEKSYLDGTSISLVQTLKHLLQLKNIWVLGIALFGIGGALNGFFGYLPLYLRHIGWRAPEADGTLVAFHAVSCIFAIPITLMSDRIQKRRIFLVVSALMTAVGIGLLYKFNGSLVWVAVIVAGITRDGFMALVTTSVTETEGVGPELTGTAIALVLLFSRVGALISPPIGNSLAKYNLSLPFLFWAAMTALSVISYNFVVENKQVGDTGAK